MHKRQVKALESLREEICRDLIVNYVINPLVSLGILTDEEKSQILTSGQSLGSVNSPQIREQVLKKQTQTFLDLFIKKCQQITYAFDKFIIILYKDDNYPWIAKRLEQLLEEEFIEESREEDPKEEKKLLISHDVPNKVKNLLERTDKVEEIRNGLVSLAEKGYGWLVIYGMGGSGKSILAAEAIREWSCDKYTDGIWWTNCGSMKKDEKFDESMLLLKMQLLWDRFDERSAGRHQKFECIESAINRLKSFFNAHQKSLIVLDDVWEREVFENFELGVPVLVTLRDRSTIPPRLDNVKYVKTIGDDDYGLTVEESRKLLALWVRSEPHELNIECVNRIIEKFKGNPLCLTLIGSVMEEEGNNPRLWQFYLDSLDSSSEVRSPRRRRSSSTRNSFVYDSFEFDKLVEHSYSALDDNMKEHFKHFSLFIEDIRIPIKVFQTIWHVKQFEVDFIMDRLVKKSLVMKNKTNNLTLYMVHDIILNFLKNQCKDELEELHSELLDCYFELCTIRTGQKDYSRLPDDGYIYYFLGYHIYKSNKLDLFAEIFLDLSFVINKIRYTGPSDLLNDYFHYKQHFEKVQPKYEDYVRFVSTNADLLCDPTIDVIQLALCQPIDSSVYNNALEFIQKTDKLYLKWCNQSNVKTSKILSTKLHSGSVRYAVFSPKESIVVSVGCDKLIRVWDSNTGKQLKTMKGHENTINCCQFSSDGSVLITASDDGTVKTWRMDCDCLFSNGGLFSPRPRSGSDYPFVFNGAACHDDSEQTYREHSTLDQGDSQTEVKCCAFSHDDRLIVSGGTDLMPRVWSLDGLKTRHILRGHKHTVQSCQFSIDSDLIVTSSGDEVIIWCSRRAEILRTLKHENNVENCLFNSKLKYVYTSSGRYVYKWSSSGRDKPICCYNNLRTKYFVTCCTISPDSRYIAAGTTTDQIIIWPSDSYSKVAVATFKGPDRITCVNFNSESTQLLSCSEDGTVIIWDTSKTFGASMVALRKKFSVLRFKSNIEVLTPDDNGTIRLFEGFEGKEDKTLALRPNPNKTNLLQSDPTYDITCCALSLNHEVLFGTSDGELIYFTLVSKLTHPLERHKKEVTFCAFINSLKIFVTASKDSTLRIYNGFSRKYDTPKYEIKENNESISKELIMGPILDCKIFSRESKVLVWCENGSLFVIGLRNNRLIARCEVPECSQINYADVTQNEELIATVSCDNSVTLWRSHIKSLEYDTDVDNSSDTNEIYPIRTIKTGSCPRSCRFSPNGNFLVIGHDDGKIKIWDFYGTESNSLRVFDDSHSDWVNDIAISPKGNLIVTVSKSIKLWNKDGKLLQTFKTNGGSMSSLYTHFVDDKNRNSDDSNTIITVDDAGVLYILQLMNFRE